MAYQENSSLSHRHDQVDKAPDCLPNNVVVQGSDGFFTEYAHITPVRRRPNHALPGSTLYWMWYNRPLTIGNPIRTGDLLGWVDNSGRTEGDPVVHIARYTPGPIETLYSRHSPCDWYIHGVDSPLMIPPATCFPGGIYPPIILPDRV